MDFILEILATILSWMAVKLIGLFEFITGSPESTGGHWKRAPVNPFNEEYCYIDDYRNGWVRLYWSYGEYSSMKFRKFRWLFRRVR